MGDYYPHFYQGTWGSERLSYFPKVLVAKGMELRVINSFDEYLSSISCVPSSALGSEQNETLPS